MKTKILMIMLAAGLGFAACSTSQNAAGEGDSVTTDSTIADTTSAVDTTMTDTMKTDTTDTTRTP